MRKEDFGKPIVCRESGMKMISIQDPYNGKKVWLFKKYACGHVRMNQEICGVKIQRGYRNVKIKTLRDLFAEGSAREQLLKFLKL